MPGSCCSGCARRRRPFCWPSRKRNYWRGCLANSLKSGPASQPRSARKKWQWRRAALQRFPSGGGPGDRPRPTSLNQNRSELDRSEPGDSPAGGASRTPDGPWVPRLFPLRPQPASAAKADPAETRPPGQNQTPGQTVEPGVGIQPKDKKELASARVQNPHEPEATYAAKGQGEKKKEHVGYKVQVAETVCETTLAPGEPTRNFIIGHGDASGLRKRRGRSGDHGTRAGADGVGETAGAVR